MAGKKSTRRKGQTKGLRSTNKKRKVNFGTVKKVSLAKMLRVEAMLQYADYQVP